MKIITTKCDIITASSKFSQLTIAGMFAVDPRKVKDIGFPRNDIMYRTNAKSEIKKVTDIDIDNSKLIFYLPTMRKGLKKEGAQFNENFFNYPDYDADMIDAFLEKHNAYIFAKVHFADNDYFAKDDFKLPKRLIFMDTEALNYHMLTIYHIMDAFDVLVTDYSSVYVDFLLLNKPIIFSCPDIEVYKRDRGFIVDDPEMFMPGAKVKTQKKFLESLEDALYGKDLYQSERVERMSIFHRYQDAGAGKRLFEDMLKVAENGVEDAARNEEDLFLASRAWLYGQEGKYEVFFDCGQGFNEKEKFVGNYLVDKDEKIIIEIEIPENAKAIRFDPDNIGRCQLKDLKILLDNQESDYIIVNGAMIEGAVVFSSIDPQIIVPIQKSVTKINIQYYMQDFFATAGKQLIEKEQELQTILNSQSWRYTRPLRKILSIMRTMKRRGR